MKLRYYVNRAVDMFRPKTRFMPLSVVDILSSQAGLSLVENFNDFYYSSGVAEKLKWRGIPLIKCPCDLWIMIELLFTLKPSLIVETGTHYGGSALLWADMMAIFGQPCTVITVDVNPKIGFNTTEKGIVSLVGYSTEPRIIEKIKKTAREKASKTSRPVMVFLDSDHSEKNVLEELRLYSPFVTLGSYLIVEDTNINGHPSASGFGSGPWEAVEKFLQENSNFIIDHDCQRFLLTFNPNGYLRRIN